MRVYKGKINKKNLPDNGVFTFGSNPLGINGNILTGKGGAALVAQIEFGVLPGEKMINRISKSGKAYGIVTVDAPKKFISIDRICDNIFKFYLYAVGNPDKLFFLAYDGEDPNSISLNGKTKLQLASAFVKAGKKLEFIPTNVIFEEKFSQLIKLY